MYSALLKLKNLKSLIKIHNQTNHYTRCNLKRSSGNFLHTETNEKTDVNNYEVRVSCLLGSPLHPVPVFVELTDISTRAIRTDFKSEWAELFICVTLVSCCICPLSPEEGGVGAVSCEMLRLFVPILSGALSYVMSWSFPPNYASQSLPNIKVTN